MAGTGPDLGPDFAPAPWFQEIAEGDGPAPPPRAFTARASDGVALRLAAWEGGAAGTVFLFPGRTEYAEKYGPIAGRLGAGGLSMLAIDWRGQGLSGRLLPDTGVGHVPAWLHYQRDVDAMRAAAEALGLPRPWHLLAHSMGGAIGLRALLRGLPVASCAFSAPMWGIVFAAALRPLAHGIALASRPLGLGARVAPGTGRAAYVAAATFEANLLTSDPERYAWMGAQLARHPELALGGPSLRWLDEALRETRALARLPSPAVPCLAAIGSEERIVDAATVGARIARWPNGRLDTYAGARHELMMERDAPRDAFLGNALAHFAAARAPGPAPG